MSAHAIDWCKKTKEVIDFAFQLEASIIEGSVAPCNIQKQVRVGTVDNEYYIERDWEKYPEVFKSDFANIARVNIVSYQIIILKESYASLFHKDAPSKFKWADRLKEPDLWAAQEILRHLRNALGHMKAMKGSFDAKATWNFTDENGRTKCPGKLEIRAINVVLDTQGLHGVPFAWNQIGGIQNFIKVLHYLTDDLYEKQQKETRIK